MITCGVPKVELSFFLSHYTGCLNQRYSRFEVNGTPGNRNTEIRKYEIDSDPPAGGDPRAEAAFEKLLEEFNILEKDLESDDNKKAEAQIILEEVKQLVDDRENRVSSASGSLDGMTTLVCIVLALLTVLTMALLPAPSRRWIKWVQSLGVAISVGLVMSLVFYIASDDYTRKAEDEQIKRVEQALEMQQPE